MSGQGPLRDERITTNIRFRRSTRRAVDEVAVLLGDLSRDDTVTLLIRDGLAAAYGRLGIEQDPAVMAAELLRVIAGTWETDLSNDELTAIGVTRKALDRIAQFRAREAPGRRT